MEIKEKTNISLYVMSASDELYYLSEIDPYYEMTADYNDEPVAKSSSYTYVLPKIKTYFANFYQCQEISVYIEKIDERNKIVYVACSGFGRTPVAEITGQSYRSLPDT